MLIAPIARLLRPVVRLLIGSGISFPVFAELVRRLYVDVALDEVLTTPSARTDSRVSLLTGIHRKEVKRLRADAAPVESTPILVTLGSQIVARWAGSPAFTDEAGHPLPLPRMADPDAADDVSFEALVTSVTRDVRPRAVLDELVSQGLVTVELDGRVRLARAAFVPRRGRPEQLFFFGRNLHDHIAAGVANVDAAGPAPFFDRSVHYDRLPPALVKRLDAAARRAAQALLVEINRTALDLIDREEGAPSNTSSEAGNSPTQRFNLGVYLYVEDERDAPPGADARP